MYCSHCGAQIAADARFCPSCGREVPGRAAEQLQPPPDVQYTAPEFEQPPYSAPGYTEPGMRLGAQIPNYLVHAIVVTICCCWPAGIVSIVYAARVNGAIGRGDLVEARRLSDNARTWAWVSFGLGLAGVVVYFLLLFAGVVAF